MLPAEPNLSHYIDSFFRNAHPIFPCLDEKLIRSLLQIQAMSPHMQPAGPDLTPALCYLIVAIGARCLDGHAVLGEVYEHYLELAYKCMASIAARPYRTAVQSYILLSWALRLVSTSPCWNWLREEC